MDSEVRVPGLILDTLASAATPGRLAWLSTSNPAMTNCRFSPTNGARSATDKYGIYNANPFYVTHIPAEPWIPRFTADGQGYQWDSWHADGPYIFWTSWVGDSDAG